MNRSKSNPLKTEQKKTKVPAIPSLVQIENLLNIIARNLRSFKQIN
jgi:hypothetical protein